MNELKIDKYYAALKLIEILLEKGLIDQTAYTQIKKKVNSHILQNVQK